jgi:hypothetical protein
MGRGEKRRHGGGGDDPEQCNPLEIRSLKNGV